MRTIVVGSPWILAIACSFDSGGVGSGGASGLQSSGTTDPTTASDESSSQSSDGSGSASSSASTMPGTTVDPVTTAVDDSGDASSSQGVTASETSSTTTGDAPESAHLQHGTHATCNNPMWCIGAGGITDPIGGPATGQECFVAPFEASQITAIQYTVGGVAPELTSFALEIYAANNGHPGMLLHSIPMTAVNATVGAHEVVFDMPIPLAITRFCVGFRTTDPGLAGALGFASSEDSQDMGVSWFTSDECGYFSWTDIVQAASAPKGNWCISVDLESTG